MGSRCRLVIRMMSCWLESELALDFFLLSSDAIFTFVDVVFFARLVVIVLYYLSDFLLWTFVVP